jgi:hypothetical protein
MAATFPSCKTCNNCDDLLAEIRRRLWSKESGGDKGLLTRISEQIYGCQTPNNTVMAIAACAGHRLAGTWAGHNAAITTQQGRLKDAVDDYDNNDCGDKVTATESARSTMRTARRAAYGGSLEVPAGGHIGPPAPANFALPRTWGQAIGDAARGVCVGGFTAGGTVVGGVAGGAAGVVGGGLVGGAAGGTGGTMALPGGGTIAGGVSGATVGAVAGGVVGVGAGGYYGYGAGQDLGNWICN